MNPDHFFGGLLIGIGVMLAVAYLISLATDQDDEL